MRSIRSVSEGVICHDVQWKQLNFRGKILKKNCSVNLCAVSSSFANTYVERNVIAVSRQIRYKNGSWTFFQFCSYLCTKSDQIRILSAGRLPSLQFVWWHAVTHEFMIRWPAPSIHHMVCCVKMFVEGRNIHLTLQNRTTNSGAQSHQYHASLRQK